MRNDLARLIVRHRHVSPMVSALLAGTNAAVTIRDVEEHVVLRRDGPGGAEGQADRFPISNGLQVVGSVEGGPIARAVAAVLSYAAAREADKRALSAEALERYRELNLIYDLAESIGTSLDVAAVAAVAADEASRLPVGGTGAVLLVAAGRLTSPNGSAGPFEGQAVGDGIVGSVAAGGDAELVNRPADDSRATEAERSLGALMCAPLKARGRVVGVLVTMTDGPAEFRAGDLKLLSAVAALAGPAIDQAAVHQSALRELDALRAR